MQKTRVNNLLSNSIIHPTRFESVRFVKGFCGRVMMSVRASRSPPTGAALSSPEEIL